LIRCYNILNVPLRLDAGEALLASFDLLYGSFVVEQFDVSGEVPFVSVLAVEEGEFTRIESPWGRVACAHEDAMVLLMFLMQNHLLRSVRDYFAVHAACLDIVGRGCILTGASTVGKSTLAVELLRRGWTVFSDEIAAVDRREKRVHAYARSLALRPHTLELVELPADYTVTEMALADELKAVVQPLHRKRDVSGRTTSASVVAFLVPPRDAERESVERSVLEVFAPEFTEKFSCALRELDGVTRVESIEGNFYPGIRILHQPGALISAAVDEAAARTNTLLAAHHRGARATIDYDLSPRVTELAARKGIEMLLGCVVNMRALMAEEGPAKMMFELSRALEGARFYEVVPGRLHETAELVESLIKQ